MDQHLCQLDAVDAFSRKCSRLAVMCYRLQWSLENRGFWTTLRRGLRSLFFAHHQIPASNNAHLSLRSVDRSGDVLGLQSGELVEVKSEAEIRASLDERDRHRGLFFASEMTEYCGRRMRVLKRVERICLEERPGEIRSLKNTVLLDGAMCQGKTVGCDRSCFFFWREAWLKRVNSDQPASNAGTEDH